MTTVVSDTSPLNYLVLIEAIDVLPKLFDVVLIPPAVYAELQHTRTPQIVLRWAAALPSWAKVQAPSRVDAEIGIGPGESEAISLAMELSIPAILIDERQGRMIAEKRGILPLGTINILYTAGLRDLIDFENAIEKLRRTSFRVGPKLVNDLVDRFRLRAPPPRPAPPPDPI